ncbi:diacylglycerol/lipid kinase family protein [Demequina capsici]|uniref:Diacylglycerol kinase family protein n=1 Tax=Demequina capsici TaxID=3075620 RepID=A0AA96FAM6_9MICO|nr:diacylglycerol kinase family protein [Demequina sp. OYTSA14]WNM25810.1 diacylglycerol kinase family protein [Demequina sp. OYTSA14]
MSTLGVVTNPTSGSGRGARWGAEALAALAARGHRLRDLSAGSWAASLESAIAHRDDLDALVVVGGDGMVHLGVQACAAHRLPLGIVAAGSGNDSATALDLPVRDVDAAVARIDLALRTDSSAEVDVAAVVGPAVEHPAQPRYALAIVSAGIDAAVSARARTMRRPRGPLKYRLAIAQELPRFTPYGVTVEIDGESVSQTCTLVAVANGPLIGGGLPLSPHSSLTDGLLELVLADGLTPTQIVPLFAALTKGRHLEDPRVRVMQVREVSVRHDPSVGRPLPPAFADGELVGAGPLTVSVVPRGLRVLGASPR